MKAFVELPLYIINQSRQDNEYKELDGQT